MSLVISVAGLKRSYGDEVVEFQALKEVTFDIEDNEFVSIMGVSGSGKSTLLHLLGLLDRPSGGSYFFNGKDTSQFSDEELARLRNREIGFVFQSFHLLPRISVLSNVILPLEYSQVPSGKWEQMATDALEKVGMTHRLAHFPTQLSGGERQRTAIARALVMNPKVILADEPTGNLDSKNGEAVMDIIRQLHSFGHTVVLVTHDEDAARTAKRMIVLKDGSLIKDEAL